MSFIWKKEHSLSQKIIIKQIAWCLKLELANWLVQQVQVSSNLKSNNSLKILHLSENLLVPLAGLLPRYPPTTNPADILRVVGRDLSRSRRLQGGTRSMIGSRGCYKFWKSARAKPIDNFILLLKNIQTKYTTYTATTHSRTKMIKAIADNKWGLFSILF